ncbi:MAG: PQQ-binding-like beta-propeller repeat protein, partial [Kiritimatiellae bacterium]|nr:PQQ-binding-like beta-propeller repeat protein [Kiritimatiellia bacterium]
WEQGGWPPTKLWEINVGFGCSSPIVVGEQLYVIGWEGQYHSRDAVEGSDVVRCRDIQTGQEKWRRTYPARLRSPRKAGDEHEYGGPLATPLYDHETGFLYTLSVDGQLRCWDASRQGEPLWSVDYPKRYKLIDRRDDAGSPRDYGFTASPLILKNMVVVEVGAKEGLLIGFDRKTGRPVWRSELAVAAGHSAGPALFQHGNNLLMAHLALDRLVVARVGPEPTGRTVAELPWKTDYGCNIAMPVVTGNRILVTSGYNISATEFLALEDSSLRRVWRTPAHAVVSSPVVKDGYIYLLAGSLKCLDAASGKTLWSGGQFGNGSIIATADGRLILWGHNTLALVEDAKRSPSTYKEVARVSPVLGGDGTCYPHVALANGKIVCRNKDGLLAVLSLKESGIKRESRRE